MLIEYTIMLKSPVLFTKNTGDVNLTSTYHYVPGTTVFGVFAGHFISKNRIKENAHENIQFKKFFLDNKIQFNNAYIKSNKKDHYAIPTPLSMQSEKQDENEYHDLLWDDELKEDTKKLNGNFLLFNVSSNKSERNFENEKVNTATSFHHERDRITGSTKDGKVFHYESMTEGQTFIGRISGDEALLKEFLDEFSDFINYKTINLGRSKNTQYGKASLQIDKSMQREKYLDIDDKEFSITLLSDTIIYNEFGFPTNDLKYLANTLGIDYTEKNETNQIQKAFSKRSPFENYVSVWKLRKPTELCFSAGSCFKIKPHSKDILNKLRNLEKSGIGERTSEGFGKFILGLQKEDFEIKNEEKKKELDKPDYPLPEFSKSIIKNIIQNEIRQKVKIMALDEYKFFARVPTNSLLGKLKVLSQNPQAQFSKDIKEEFRQTAKDQLHKCRVEGKTLDQFIIEFSVKLKLEKSQKVSSRDLEDLIKLSSYRWHEDVDFLEELRKKYFHVLFSSLRKRNRG